MTLYALDVMKPHAVCVICTLQSYFLTEKLLIIKKKYLQKIHSYGIISMIQSQKTCFDSERMENVYEAVVV